jgi:cobalt-zinc-cadmium resistance protein CzcA
LLEAERRFEKQKLLPDISLNYFQGSNSQLNGNLYGYQFGLKIPLLFGGQSSRIKAAKIAEDIATAESSEYEIQLMAKLDALQVNLTLLQEALDYYEKEGNMLSEEILKTADGSFRNGEIDFYQYIQSLESAYDIKLGHLDKLKEYNQTIIAINYITL